MKLKKLARIRPALQQHWQLLTVRPQNREPMRQRGYPSEVGEVLSAPARTRDRFEANQDEAEALSETAETKREAPPRLDEIFCPELTWSVRNNMGITSRSSRRPSALRSQRGSFCAPIR